MTTTIKVEAHCDFNKTQVEIVLNDGTKTIIQDGECETLYVHDDRAVTVRVVAKVPEVKQETPLSAECPD